MDFYAFALGFVVAVALGIGLVAWVARDWPKD